MNIHEIIRQLFPSPQWCYITELRAGTGYSEASNRYLDAWAMEVYPSSPMRRVAIEIKMSRSDFCAEKRRPMKRDPAIQISNQFYFAAPKGLLHERDIPTECGLIEVDEIGKAEITVEAPHRETGPISLPFLASVVRHAAKTNQ